MATYKQLETSREVRLWLGQIIIPAATLGVTVMNIPEVRQAVDRKINSLRTSANRKLKKT